MSEPVSPNHGAELRLTGIPASPGVVSGKLAVFSKEEEVRVHPTKIREEQIEDEMRRLEAPHLVFDLLFLMWVAGSSTTSWGGNSPTFTRWMSRA